MRLLVPFDATAPKTRLGSMFAADERTELARVMLKDVIDVLRDAGYEPTVLATAAVDCDAPVEIDTRPLTPAVNAVLHDADEAVAVVMADLPLVTAASLERLFEPAADLVIAPGRAAGTNAFVSRHPDFHVDYHGTSFTDHLAIAEAIGASVAVVDSHRLSTDVDEPADLIEVLVHGEGTDTWTWLRERGVDVAIEADRVEVTRGGS